MTTFNEQEPTLTRLKRERDESKQRFDEMSGRRESFIAQRQQLINEADSAQVAFQIAVSQGDVDAMWIARARQEEIRQQRADFSDVIAALANSVGVLRGRYGEAHDQLRFAENEMEYLMRHIPNLRRALATAQRRVGEYTTYNSNNSPEVLNAELQKFEGRYFMLTGQQLPEQPPVAA